MANEAQREYWNTAPGRRWVTLQESFDRSFQEMTALLTAAAGIQPGEAVLDVGCGSGATTLEAARRTGPGGRATGVDVSEPLLNLARERTAAAGLANVELLLADAQTHAFGPEEFDILVSRLGLMFFDAPVAAFRNLRAALRPGGRLCFVAWAGLEANPWFALPLAAGRRRIGPAKPQPPGAPGPLAFSDAGYVRGLLEDAGFTNVSVAEELTWIAGHGTPEEEAEFAFAAGPLARLVNETKPGAEVRAEIAREIAEAFRPYAGENGLRVPTSIYCVTAVTR